jgi:AcrR family transcriptional regulator
VTQAPDREPPRTERGARTRAALVDAARRVFEREGYLNTKITDITREAATATGSFYTYFADKEEVFAAVMDGVRHEMLHPQLGAVGAQADAIAEIEAANRAYLDAVRRNARLVALMEQVGAIDERFREWRQATGRAFIERNAAGIRRLQRDGQADRELDPELAAHALSGMVSRMGYQAFVSGEVDAELDDVVDAVTRLWANALRVSPGSGTLRA